MAGVLVAGGCELGRGPGEYGGGDGRVRDTGLSAVVSLVDDICVVFIGAGLRGARLPSVCVVSLLEGSSRASWK